MTGAPLPVVSDLGTGFGLVAFALQPEPLGELAEILAGGDLREGIGAHVRAAAANGGIQVAVEQHPPTVAGVAAPNGWAAVVARPDSRPTGTALVRNALPREVATMKHYRQAALAAGLVLGLERGDARLVRAAAADAILEPSLGPRFPGFFPARNAALAAGALLYGFDARSGCVAALVDRPEIGDRVAAAIDEAFTAHAASCTSVSAPLAPLREVAT